MSGLFQDLRYALRQMAKSPGFTLVAVITLALGIGANTAVFSVVDQVLLHPLPYPDSDRIERVSETFEGIPGDDAAPANYLDWVAQNHVFAPMAASRGWQGSLSAGDRPERIRGTMATPSFFTLFGINPILGRGLEESDAQAGNDHVVVLGYGLWQRYFGADRGIVGRNIRLNGEEYSVVGVMPPNYSPDDYGELWVPSPWSVPTHPLVPDKDPRAFRDRKYLDVWARLKPGVTPQQAQAELDTISRRLEKQYPDSNNKMGVSFLPLREYIVGDIRPVLLILLAAVAVVLLIGCANVANLLLARAAVRAREISIRTTLGASRRRLLRQLLTESVLLALLGGAVALLLAVAAVPALLALSPPDIRQFQQIGINREVLAFSFLASIICGVIFGLMPALQASRSNPTEFLKEGERGSTGNRGRTRSALVIAEVGLSLVLLVGAGLLVKSFTRLMEVNPGFDPDHLLTFNVALPSSTDAVRQLSFYQQVVQRLQALPGVRAVGAVSRLPMTGGNSSRSFNIPGNEKDYNADIRICTADYFHTMGIPLLKGRNFSENDVSGSLKVAVVNEALVRAVFPGQDPIGKQLTHYGPDDLTLQIVGVVGNVRHVGLDTAPHSEIYQLLGQAQWPSVYVAMRSATSDATSLTSLAQSAVWSVNKDVPLANIRTMQELIANSVQRRRFSMLLLTIFAAVAMVLAAIGLYGVMSYSVAQRTKEIGIRMALGARRPDVVALVVKQGMVLVLMGIVAGTVLSLGMTRLIAGMLFGISATDPLTFVGVAMLLGAVAFFANYLPARRGASVDPMVALRYE
ncbi:MAG TPA: ABC transporter permease [Terriglobales bacterium]|jgi:putative ABC transport system permease protein|nr:ABC transporter permease [Terriglobales bacterium]